MSRIIWVHKEVFDKSLDRTTWVEMATALRRRGYGVHMVCAYAEHPVPLPAFDDVTWLPLSGPGLLRRLRFQAKSWSTVQRLVLRERPELVILDEWTSMSSFPMDFATRIGLGKTKFVMDMRTIQFGVTDNRLALHDRAVRLQTRVALLYDRAAHHGLTVIVPALGEIVRTFGARRRIGVWGSGIAASTSDLHSTPPASSPALDAWRRSAYRMIYHGGLGHNRGLSTAVRAIEVCRDRGFETPVLLLLGDGPNSSALRGQARELGLESQCIVHPSIPYEQVAPLIAEADLGIMDYPDLRYWDANHPIKLMEYLGAGVPVICSDTPVFRNIDPSGDVLIYVQPDSPEALADKITECVAGDENLNTRVQLGYGIAADNTWDRQAERLLSYVGLPARSG